MSQFEDAIKAYEEALSKYPDNAPVQARALLGKGYSLTKLERYEEARLTLSKCIDVYGQDPNESVKNIVARCRQIMLRIQFKS